MNRVIFLWSLNIFFNLGSRKSPHLFDGSTSSWGRTDVRGSRLCSVHCPHQLQVGAFITSSPKEKKIHKINECLLLFLLTDTKLNWHQVLRRKEKVGCFWHLLFYIYLHKTYQVMLLNFSQLLELLCSASWKLKNPRPERRTCSAASR